MRASILDEPAYLAFLARTHPDLQLRNDRLELPSFVAPLPLSDALQPGRKRAAITQLAAWFPGWLQPKTLFLGSPFEPYEQTSLLRGRDPEAIRRQVERAGSREDAELAVLTSIDARAPELSAWKAAGFIAVPSFPDVWRPIQGLSLEDELKRIPGPDRSSVRRNIRAFQEAGLRLRRLTDSSELAAALYGAYRPMYQRARVKWLRHSLAYFEGLAALGPRVWLTVAEDKHGALAGFVVSFEDALGLQAGRLGVSPAWRERSGVYFRLLYSTLESAIAARPSEASRLSLEPTAYRLKRHLGGELRPMVNLMLGLKAPWKTGLRAGAPLSRPLLGHLTDPEALEAHY